jgi:acrylyl-CoA reductase (NADPH)
MIEFLAYLVDRDNQGKVHGSIKSVNRDSLPPGEVLIKAQWSSLNYKDALAATGHPGVVRRFPHIPGIDVAGVVEGVSGS